MRRFAKRLLILLGSTLLALVLAEVAARSLIPRSTPPPAVTGKDPAMKSKDSELGWEPRPNSARKWTYTQHGGEDRVARATVNEHGARGPAHPFEKASGVFRIVTLGDSFTYGSGVADRGTWPAALERFLGRPSPVEGGADVAPCEVWNFGVEGYNTQQEIRLLRERVLPQGIDPDLVVLAFFFNDVDDRSNKPPPLTGWRKLVMSYSNNSPQGLAKWLREHSVLAETLAYKFSRAILTSNWTQKVSMLFEDGTPGWEAVKTGLREGRDLAREGGFDFVVALYPPLWRDGEHLASHEPYRMFAEWCASESISCVNLDPVLDGLAVEQYWIHPRNHHPTAPCHELAGEAIGEFLVTEELVPRD